MSNISILDLLFITYLIWSSVRGKQRGLGKELEGLIVALLFLATLLGIFVISVLSGLIKSTLEATLLSSGFLISLGSLILAVIVFFTLRKKISEFSETNFSSPTSQHGGAVIGFLRGAVSIAIISILLSGLPFGLFEESVKKSQIYNRVELILKLDKTQASPPPTVSNESEELIIGY